MMATTIRSSIRVKPRSLFYKSCPLAGVPCRHPLDTFVSKKNPARGKVLPSRACWKRTPYEQSPWPERRPRVGLQTEAGVLPGDVGRRQRPRVEEQPTQVRFAPPLLSVAPVSASITPSVTLFSLVTFLVRVKPPRAGMPLEPAVRPVICWVSEIDVDHVTEAAEFGSGAGGAGARIFSPEYCRIAEMLGQG